MFPARALVLKTGFVMSFGLLAAACNGAAVTPTPTAPPPTITPTPINATATPYFVSGAATPTGTIIAAKPTYIVSTNFPTDTPVVIPTDTTTPTPITPQPTVTSSGPLLPESQNNASSFATSAPGEAGPFTLVKDSAILSKYGVRLMYKSEDGQVYEVVLWITTSAQDAVDRYSLEIQSVQAQQNLGIGDESIYSMADTHILAIIHYRNVVIDVYRPEDPSGTVPLESFTDDQVKALLQKLFAALPPMS